MTQNKSPHAAAHRVADATDKHPHRVIGLTGESGSGKTTVAQQLTDYGGIHINADALAHEVIKRGRPAYIDITTHFDAAVLARILTADGEIDRRQLGHVVFNDRAQLAFLESVIHPRVCTETLSIIDAFERGETPGAFVVIDAPLLIEAGMQRYCGSVWVVTAPSELREARVADRDGLTSTETTRRVRDRRDLALLLAHADTILENDGTPEALAAKVDAAFRQTAVRLGI